MSNYKHTSTIGDAHVVLETDDSDFMREYIKNEEITTYGVDHVVNLSDIHIKTDYMKDIADSLSSESKLADKINELQIEMKGLWSENTVLARAIADIQNKEKRNAR